VTTALTGIIIGATAHHAFFWLGLERLLGDDTDLILEAKHIFDIIGEDLDIPWPVLVSVLVIPSGNQIDVSVGATKKIDAISAIADLTQSLVPLLELTQNPSKRLRVHF